MPSSEKTMFANLINLGLFLFRNVLKHLNKSRTKRLKVISAIDIGKGWAGNTINTPIFRHHALLTLDGFQYTAYYADKRTLRIIKRCLVTNTIASHDIVDDYNLYDAHNSISLGYDRDKHLHITYDHHATKLKYRRSTQPCCIDSWELHRQMTGKFEDMVTYPTFILPRNSFPLTFLFRDGSWDKGKARLKFFDETTGIWQDQDSAILSGSDEKPWTCNAYWNHPAIGDDGSLHLSYVWRTHCIGDRGLINNINVCYAKSSDNGKTWFTSRQREYKLPITPVNTEVVQAVSPATNLINQCGMAVDTKNNPHIVYYANDDFGIPQYQHLWFDGRAWHCQQLSDRTKPYDLQGGGTLKIPISRPDIVIDKADNVHVIFRGDITSDRMAIMTLKHPNYEHASQSVYVIDEEMLGFTEPVIDRSRWQESEVLSIFIQHCDQPNHDQKHSEKTSSIRIIDLQLRD